MTIPRQVQVLEHLTTIIVNDSTCRGRSVGGSGRCAVDNGYSKALNCLGVSKGLAAAETDHAPYSRMFPQVNTALDVLLGTFITKHLNDERWEGYCRGQRGCKQHAIGTKAGNNRWEQ